MHRLIGGVVVLAAALGSAGCKSKEEAPAKAAAPLAAAATDEIWAASAHLRVVDPAQGAVVGKLDLQKAQFEILFAPDGQRGWSAGSDGVRVLDPKTRAFGAKITDHPSRVLELAESGAELFVVEHEVTVLENGAREASAYRLLTLDAATGAVKAKEEIGHGVLWARPAEGDQGGLVVTESGEVRFVRPGQALAAGEAVSVAPSEGGLHRVRDFPVAAGGAFFVPVEAEPARVVEIDRKTGAARVHVLPGASVLRGLAVAHKSRRLYANAADRLYVVALADGKVGEPLALGAFTKGAALAPDERHLYVAQTVDGTGGAVIAVALDPLAVAKKVHLDDISPWAIAVR